MIMFEIQKIYVQVAKDNLVVAIAYSKAGYAIGSGDILTRNNPHNGSKYRRL